MSGKKLSARVPDAVMTVGQLGESLTIEREARWSATHS